MPTFGAMKYSIYEKDSDVRITMETWPTREAAEATLPSLNSWVEVREVPEPGGGKFGLREIEP